MPSHDHRESLQVTACGTDDELAAAARLFARYRLHYEQPWVAEEQVLDWLTEMVGTGMLTVYTAARTASEGASGGAAPIGLATAHAVPASLALGRSWQLRDLYVDPGSRRQGVAAALVDAVREAALAAGATRLSLVTEPDNQPALGLYRRLGFRSVDGLTTLSLDLAGAQQEEAQ